MTRARAPALLRSGSKLPHLVPPCHATAREQATGRARRRGNGCGYVGYFTENCALLLEAYIKSKLKETMHASEEFYSGREKEEELKKKEAEEGEGEGEREGGEGGAEGALCASRRSPCCLPIFLHCPALLPVSGILAHILFHLPPWWKVPTTYRILRFPGSSLTCPPPMGPPHSPVAPSGSPGISLLPSHELPDAALPTEDAHCPHSSRFAVQSSAEAAGE